LGSPAIDCEGEGRSRLRRLREAVTFTASDVLLKAASRIEEEGMWCQGRMYLGKAACALGTILRIADELNADPDDAWDLLDDWVHAKHEKDAVGWNDTPGRNAHEVAEAMRNAAL
jgi:hypothetical protein